MYKKTIGGRGMQKLAVIFVLLCLTAQVQGAPFSDVPRTHWAYDAIDQAVSSGILQGYDGKFVGNRKLNRFQMAVITSNILDYFAKSGNDQGPKLDQSMIAKLEAMTIEFAEELALMSVRVASLEDTLAELKAERNKPVQKTVSKDVGFTAFAAFALVMNDDQNGGASRYSNLNRGAGATFFDMQQVSLGVDKQVDPSVYFHAQIDFLTDLNSGGGIGVNEAYFIVDELFGDVGAKVGAFASPFSLEHNGAFRSCNLSITPSIANTYHERYRFTGLELQPVKDVAKSDILWKFAIVSATDNVAAPGVLLTDYPVNVSQGEGDDSFGFYAYAGKKAEKAGDWGWNFAYFNNGGDNTPGAGFTPSPGGETDFFQLGFEWAEDEFILLLQYLNGTSDTGTDNDFYTFYVLLNYRIDNRQNITLRYDKVEQDVGNPGSAEALTIAYNRKLTDNSFLQFEFLSPDDGDFGATAADDFTDDLIQLRYKVHF